jgi:hypothetical protein
VQQRDRSDERDESGGIFVDGASRSVFVVLGLEEPAAQLVGPLGGGLHGVHEGGSQAARLEGVEAGEPPS